MQSIDLPRAIFLALLLVMVVAGSLGVRNALLAVGEGPSPTATATATATAILSTSPSPDVAVLPSEDVPGADLASLPRYPGSVRIAYSGSRDDRMHREGAQFLAAATVDEVRAFYQDIAAEHGWQRADVDYSDGSWSYVLVNGGTEAFVVIEPAGGLAHIQLQLSSPIAAPPPAVRPATPPSDNGGDDDDDDDDDDGGDDSDEDDD